jgi:hypothetical protein
MMGRIEYGSGRVEEWSDDPPPTSPEIRAAHWRIYYATGSLIALRLTTQEER